MTSNIKRYILLFFSSIVLLSVAEPLPSVDADAWKPRYMRKIEREDKKR
ncbi:MAG: hypothetical protein J6W61_01875 [Bacteroidales bacterium]|nr:hypothetical protein [Bacteroidales bacterium]